MTDRVYNVLFLCTANSARSIMAEAILEELGRGRFRAFSAGSQPRGAVNPSALDLLRRLGHDVSGLRSKSWDAYAQDGAPPMDFILTVCDNAANEACPFWPGQPVTAHWGIPDPAAAEGNEAEVALAFDDAYRMLRRRIELLSALPVGALDELALPSRLRDIHATADNVEPFARRRA